MGQQQPSAHPVQTQDSQVAEGQTQVVGQTRVVPMQTRTTSQANVITSGEGALEIIFRVANMFGE